MIRKLKAPLVKNAFFWFCLVEIALILWLYGDIITGSTNTYIYEQSQCHVYANMWEHLWQGRFDLDSSAIAEIEAFHRNGKIYSYFGLFPSFVRGFFSQFVDINHSCTEFISAGIAILIAVFAQLWAAKKLDILGLQSGKVYAIYFLNVVLCGPLFAMLLYVTIHQEAILWGAAWSLVFNLFFLDFLVGKLKRRGLNLIGMAISSTLCLHSRPTVALPTFFVMSFLSIGVLIGWFKAKSISRGRFAALILFGFGSLSVAFVNYERWGTPFHFGPVSQYSTRALNADTKGAVEERGAFAPVALGGGAMLKEFSLGYVLPSFVYYFVPKPDNFQPQWPWFKYSETDYFGEVSSPQLSMSLMSSSYMIISAFVICLIFRNRVPAEEKSRLMIYLAGNILGWLILFSYFGKTFRYQADLFPTFSFLTIYGLYLMKLKRIQVSPAKIAAASTVTLLNILVVMSLPGRLDMVTRNLNLEYLIELTIVLILVIALMLREKSPLNEDQWVELAPNELGESGK